MKLDSIEECNRNDRLVDKLKTRLYTTEEDELIHCEDWTVASSLGGKAKYRVKLYQSARDRFFSLIFPPRLSGHVTLYWNSQI